MGTTTIVDVVSPYQVALRDKRDYITPEDISDSCNSGIDKILLAVSVLDCISDGSVEDAKLCAYVASEYLKRSHGS